MCTRRPLVDAIVPAAVALCAGFSLGLPPAQQTFPPLLDLGLLGVSSGLGIRGIDPGSQTGGWVSRAGDINGDGIDDLIIGAASAASNGLAYAGESYVVFGSAGLQALGGALELSALDGTNGFVIQGAAENDRSGVVTAIGDINNDGFDDVAIGAPNAAPEPQGFRGRVYIVFGGAHVGEQGLVRLALLDGTDGFVMEAPSNGGYCGLSVSGAGDVNGDGIADMVVGAPLADVDGESFAGQAFVVFGAAGIGGSGSFDLQTLDGVNGFVVDGAVENDGLGFACAGVGDLNADGLGDIVIGATAADPGGVEDAGAAFVIFGRSTATAGPFAPSLSVAALDGASGFVVPGIGTRDWCGRSVSAAGDVNADGVDDMLVGAPNATRNGVSGGEAYVVFGRDPVVHGAFPASVDLASLNGVHGWTIRGLRPSHGIGHALAKAGDLNDDGVDDVVFGGHGGYVNGKYGFGECSVVFGGSSVAPTGQMDPSQLDGANGFVVRGAKPGDYVGDAVSGGADLNDDGTADLIVGATFARWDGTSASGGAWLLFGIPKRQLRVAPADLDGDGIVHGSDFAVLLANFGSTGTEADLDGSGSVDIGDLIAFVRALGDRR